MMHRTRAQLWALVAIVALGAVAAQRAATAEIGASPRMWLELDPGRFEKQNTVVELLWLDGLNKRMALPSKDAVARRGLLYSRSGEAWEHDALLEPVRPESFQPPELRELADLGGPGRLFWRATDVTDPSTVLEMIGDLEQIWGGGMQAAVSDYSAAFEMLGQFHQATAEVREGQGRLTGRLVLVAASESDAKQASSALSLASMLGKMVASGAVKSGHMSADEAAALKSVLGSIQTRVDGTRLTVHLGIDLTTLRKVMP